MRIKSAFCAAFLAYVSLTNIGSAAECDGLFFESASLFAGPHCLDGHPKRVVVLDPSFSLGIGLDVGLQIVGAPLTRMGDKVLHDRATAANIADLGFVTEPSLERIVALQPDLIIGFTGNNGLAESIYPLFSQIAPTMLETNADWRAYYHTLAKLSGDENNVKQQFETLETRIKDLQGRLVDSRSVSVLRITSWDLQSFASGPEAYAPFALLSEVGVQRSAYEDAVAPNDVLNPDWEELAKLDSDVLLYIVGGTNNSDVDGRHEEVLNHPLWKMLPAVQAGRVHRVDHGTWMEFNGISSAHKILDDIETYVLDAD